MSNTIKGLIVGVVSAIFVGIICISMYFGYSNAEVRLRNAITAQQKTNNAVFDNTWKILSQKCQIADKYKSAFMEIYPELMKGRYEKGGGLMKFVTEANPNFDVSLYKDLVVTIEAQRNIFTREQNKLIDLKREHDNIRLTFPSSIVCGGKPEIEIQVVTSAKTKEVFSTGEENDVKF